MVATIDAATGSVVNERRPDIFDCNPESDTRNSAVGVPQNQNEDDPIGNRSLWASPTTELGQDYSHEGHRSAHPLMVPVDIQIFRYVTSPNGCSPLKFGNTVAYDRLPVKTISSAPTYDDYNGIPGRSGGDGMWTTYQTMSLLGAKGWHSYDDNGSRAAVVVNAYCGGYHDAAAFNEYAIRGPVESVLACPVANRDYEETAALDVMAHEWGHGIVKHSAGFLWQELEDRQANEGWADIIGYWIEWGKQSQCYGEDVYDCADWTMGEDSGDAFRWVTTDDGEGGLSFHSEDDPGEDDPEHWGGNPLPVAYYIAAEGVENPICDNNPGYFWCNQNPPTGIGADGAGDALFVTLAEFATSSDSWDDFGDLAALGAFETFYHSGPCYAAKPEQETMHKAFAAIGWQGSGDFICPCQPDPCGSLW